MSAPLTDEVLRRLKKLSEEDFKKSFLPTTQSIQETEEVFQAQKEHRSRITKNPFYKQNYEIIMNFISKLKKDKLFDPILNPRADEIYKTTLKISSSQITYDEFIKEIESKNGSVDFDRLCDSYRKAFEQICKLFFKTFASAIKKKNIESCASAIKILTEYDKNMKIIFIPFIPQIRNSISHNDWYFDPLILGVSLNRSTVYYPPPLVEYILQQIQDQEPNHTWPEILTNYDIDIAGTYRRTWKYSMGRVSSFMRSYEMGSPPHRKDEWNPNPAFWNTNKN